MGVRNQHARKKSNSFFIGNTLFVMDTFNSDYPYPSESAFRYHAKKYKGNAKIVYMKYNHNEWLMETH